MKIGLLGASGYTGGELLRLLESHPDFEPHFIGAFTHAGEKIINLHPQLVGYGDQLFDSMNVSKANECELLFLAMPHGESAAIVSQISGDKKIVDLGADFRLENSDSWERYYGGEHAGTWVYGMPELPGSRQKIAASSKIANPGCYATAIALGAFPALSVIDVSDIVVVAASGTTGAGRSPKVTLLGSEVMNSLTSYKFGGVHQHTPEIEESLSRISNTKVGISFTPILAPMPRGILATITARLAKDISSSSLRELYRDAFMNEEFLSLLPEGMMPRTASVVGSNYVHVQVALDEHSTRVVISVAIDNLGKGAASQAIQNANIMCGLKEDLGLKTYGVGV